MEEQTTDILQRLETAVQAWTTEVDEAQRKFGEQLAETRGRMQTNAEAALEALQNTMSEHLLAIQSRLEDSTEVLREALSRIDALEDEVARLKRDAAAMREAAPGLDVSPPEEPGEHEPAPVEEEAEHTRKVTIQPFDERGAPRRMGEILADAGLITQEQLEQALDLQRQFPQRKLGSILVEQGFTGEEVIPQVLARQLRIPYLRLKEDAFDPEAVALINGRLAARHACIPLRATSDTIALAMANPLDLIAIEDVEHATGKRVHPLIARESEIMAAIHERYDDA